MADASSRGSRASSFGLHASTCSRCGRPTYADPVCETIVVVLGAADPQRCPRPQPPRSRSCRLRRRRGPAGCRGLDSHFVCTRAGAAAADVDMSRTHSPSRRRHRRAADHDGVPVHRQPTRRTDARAAASAVGGCRGLGETQLGLRRSACFRCGCRHTPTRSPGRHSSSKGLRHDSVPIHRHRHAEACRMQRHHRARGRRTWAVSLASTVGDDRVDGHREHARQRRPRSPHRSHRRPSSSPAECPRHPSSPTCHRCRRSDRPTPPTGPHRCPPAPQAAPRRTAGRPATAPHPQPVAPRP